MGRRIPMGVVAMGISRPKSDELVLTIEEHEDDPSQYVARWEASGEPVVSYIPSAMWDIIPWMAARRLMEQGLDPDRMFIVRLVGADFIMMRCTLGQAAATPLVNFAAPVHEPASVVYKRPQYVG